MIDEFGIRFGVGKEKAGLCNLIGDEEIVRLRPPCEKFRAQLFVRCAVLRLNQKSSQNRKMRVVSGAIFKYQSSIVGGLLPLTAAGFYLHPQIQQFRA